MAEPPEEAAEAIADDPASAPVEPPTSSSQTWPDAASTPDEVASTPDEAVSTPDEAVSLSQGTGIEAEDARKEEWARSDGEEVVDLPAGSVDAIDQAAGATAGTEAWAAVSVSLSDLNERFEESQRLLSRQVELVDRLHAENQRLRSGELRGAISPLIRDLLRLHDDIGRLRDLATEESQRDLQVARVSLLDALARSGVVGFEPAATDRFDPKLHSVVGILAADGPDGDRTIAEVVRIGFRWEDGQIVRPCEVKVFKHRAAESDSAPPEPTGEESETAHGQ
jgi:molecular chaperone GrpE (heat shock protein)